MSFASEVKKEIMRTDFEKDCCCRAELCAIICFCGSVSYEEGQPKLRVATESAAAAKRCFALLKRSFGITGGVETKKSRAGRGGYSYVLEFDKGDITKEILSGLKLFDDEYREHVRFVLSDALIGDECCKRAFVKGAFLGGGSLANPEKSYHLEFATHHHGLADDSADLLAGLGFTPKIIIRKSNYVLYFKNSEEIADILSLLGAYRAMMEFTNVKIVKDTRNNVNRQVNCETANLNKTWQAAREQVEAIEKIKKAGLFDGLPDGLRAIAEARMEYPEENLEFVAAKITPPLSKSGAAHRLKKLLEIADKISKKTGEK